MEYQTNWIEDNLGITRKDLWIYEEKKLLPRILGIRKRKYNDEDIKILWTIKVLRSIGYSLKEIVFIMKTSELDLHKSIDEKIDRLEAEQSEKQRYIDYAKTIKATGKIPLMPKEI